MIPITKITKLGKKEIAIITINGQSKVVEILSGSRFYYLGNLFKIVNNNQAVLM